MKQEQILLHVNINGSRSRILCIGCATITTVFLVCHGAVIEEAEPFKGVFRPESYNDCIIYADDIPELVNERAYHDTDMVLTAPYDVSYRYYEPPPTVVHSTPFAAKAVPDVRRGQARTNSRPRDFKKSCKWKNQQHRSRA